MSGWSTNRRGGNQYRRQRMNSNHFLSQPKGAYVLCCAAVNDTYESSIRELYRYFVAHLIACRPKSLVDVLILGSDISETVLHRSSCNLHIDAETGYEGIYAIIQGVDYVQGREPQPGTMNMAEGIDFFCPTVLDSFATTHRSRSHGEVISIISSIVASLEQMKVPVRTKPTFALPHGKLRAAYYERRVVMILPDDLLNSDELEEDDWATFNYLYPTLDELDAFVDIVFCSPSGVDNTGPQAVRIAELASRGVCQLFSARGTGRLNLFPATSFITSLADRSSKRVKKVNPKVKYDLMFNSELQLSVQSFLLEEKLSLPTATRVVTETMGDVVMDQVFRRMVDTKVGEHDRTLLEDHVVPPEDIKKGYKYGHHIVPVGPAEEEFLVPKSTKGLKVVGRVKKDTYRACLFKGVAEIVFSMESDMECRALRSLCISLAGRKEVLVAESVFRNGLHPQLCILQPVSFGHRIEHLCIDDDDSVQKAALLLNYIPWAEEIRVGIPVIMPGMRLAKDRQSYQIPTDGQMACMRESVAQLGTVGRESIETKFDNPIAQKFGTALMTALALEEAEGDPSALRTAIDAALLIPLPNMCPDVSKIEIDVIKLKKEFPLSVPLTSIEKKAAAEELLQRSDAMKRTELNLQTIKLEPDLNIEIKPEPESQKLDEVTNASHDRHDADTTIKVEVEEEDDDYDYVIDFDNIF